jgi:hypothetical protein
MVPLAQSVCEHVPATQRSVAHGTPLAHCESLQQAAHTPPPQSRRPPLHTHAPETQVRPDGHALPHAPQLALLLAMFTSQPSVGMPLQSAHPGSHAKPHEPIEQITLALGLLAHAVAQSPQCEGSLERSAHIMPHWVRPVGQLDAQLVPVHTGMLTEQTVPHAPQLLGSVLATLQSVAVDGQRRKPLVHWQLPPVQLEFIPHGCAHAPQFIAEVRVSISQPFEASWSQSAKPGAHWQLPPEHT